jgi:hypothetical protein
LQVETVTASVISVIGVVTAAVLGAVTNQWWTGRNAVRAARRDYEYDANKRLLAQVQPRLFELSERCDEAFLRIFGIAQSEAQGRLDPACAKHRFRSESGYYLPSTIYRLVTPLVLARMLETELGRFDFSLVPTATAMYRLAKVLYRTWNSGESLARTGAAISYEPEAVAQQRYGYDVAVHSRQHVRLGAIDTVVDLLTGQESDGRPRCIRYGEFQAAYDLMRHEKAERKAKCRAWSSPNHAALSRVANVFSDFSPSTKPVLWRILMTQAVLLQWIALDFQSKDSHTSEDVVELVRSRFAAVADEKSLDAGLAAAQAYLSTHVA